LKKKRKKILRFNKKNNQFNTFREFSLIEKWIKLNITNRTINNMTKISNKIISRINNKDKITTHLTLNLNKIITMTNKIINNKNYWMMIMVV
jgi:hypothetical protein